MFFDARGNLFTGGPNGVAVFDKSGASQVYGTGTSTFPVVSYNAANNQFALTLGGFNDPMHLGSSPLIYRAADFNVPAPSTATWNEDADGNWSDGSRWDHGAAPNGVDQQAVFGNAITAPRTVTLDLPVTLGTLSMDSSQKYTVSGASALTMQVSAAIAAINVTGGGHEIATPVVLASDTDITLQNASDTLTVSGPVSGGGTLSKEGNGSLTITGPNTYAGNTAIDGGRLRFQIASGVAIVGAEATVTIAPGATLELAGAVSALGAAGGNRARVINDSAAPGLIVSGTNQAVGGIDGAGATMVNGGSDLSADHINQTALVIGGSATSFARLTIAPSDASGNPLDAGASAMILANSLTPMSPFGEGIDLTPAIAEPKAARAFDGVSLTSVPGVGMNPVTVPEPSSCALLILAIVALLAGTKCHTSISDI
jgi:autotransporter-associated beta strand protein